MCITYEKEIIMIGYYNVMFFLTFRKGYDDMKKKIIMRRVDSGEEMNMQIIYRGCILQEIPVTMRFTYRTDFPFMANLWNLYSYIRFQFEKKSYFRN